MHLSDIKCLDGEHVHSSSFKVVPQVIVRYDQHHSTGVIFLPVQLHKDPGVWAATADVACLHCDMIADIWKPEISKFISRFNQVR